MVARTLEELLTGLAGRVGRLERRRSGHGGGGGTVAPAKGQAGLVAAWDTETPPPGWLICNGALVSRTAYPDLFAVLGTRHGAGDGSTTFQLPNYGGRALVGRDQGQVEFDSIGKTGGAKTHRLIAAESGVPGHKHALGPGQNFGMSFGPNSAAGVVFRLPVELANAPGSYQGPYEASNNAAADAAQAHNNLQPYAVALWIISTGEQATAGGSGSSGQARLSYRLPSNVAVPADTTIPFTTAVENVGFTASGGIFTATVAGRYHVHAQVRQGSAPVGGGIAIWVNGGIYSYSPSAPATQGNSGWQVSTYLTLQPGDQISIGNGGNAFTSYNGDGTVLGSSYVQIERVLAPLTGSSSGSSSANRGTTVERDAAYGVPFTDADKAALANRLVAWFNTDKGYTESYYALKGTPGLTKPGMHIATASDWYPVAGSPIYATLQSDASQSVTPGRVRVTFPTLPLVIAGGIVWDQAASELILPIGGNYETSASVVKQSTGTLPAFFNLYMYGNSALMIQQSGTVFPHAADHSRADIVPFIRAEPKGVKLRLETEGNNNGSLLASTAFFTVKYVSPPFAV